MMPSDEIDPADATPSEIPPSRQARIDRLAIRLEKVRDEIALALQGQVLVRGEHSLTRQSLFSLRELEIDLEESMATLLRGHVFTRAIFVPARPY